MYSPPETLPKYNDSGCDDNAGNLPSQCPRLVSAPLNYADGLRMYFSWRDESRNSSQNSTIQSTDRNLTHEQILSVFRRPSLTQNTGKASTSQSRRTYVCCPILAHDPSNEHHHGYVASGQIDQSATPGGLGHDEHSLALETQASIYTLTN